ncbi:hypothetical protein CYMTET_21493 [Cymbomonas tetramitiformis]|uniref:Uncharacterized protein n=1 Tax=Cymbomonas tetramitiformis TaxID=36881 RepID=A0AAE0G392_9CHLO|nr:hypothetical protein CYMTET_21493 [Cymbomonas tetramitiformis]
MWRGFMPGNAVQVAVTRTSCTSDRGCTEASCAFTVNGKPIEAFDASSILVPCNEPRCTRQLEPQHLRLLRAALYCAPAAEGVKKGGSEQGGAEEEEEGAALLRHLSAVAVVQRKCVQDDTAPEWLDVARASPLAQCVWRDCLLKLTTREGSHISVAPCDWRGERTSLALQPLTEGTLVRLLLALESLYPTALEHVGELRWRVRASGAAYVHLMRCLSLLARGSYDDGARFAGIDGGAGAGTGERGLRGASPSTEGGGREKEELSDALPRVETILWEHQRESAGRVLDGLRAGKRGFADASSVGSGKTLTALATCCNISAWLAGAGLPPCPLLPRPFLKLAATLPLPLFEGWMIPWRCPTVW